ncbi:MAG: hypothetical protein GXO18_01710 [Aquificae bacterium]|nr:hypothetical protein [Aquificota bacterium]
MTFLILVLGWVLLAHAQYNGLITYKGQVLDCGHLLNKYAHSGVPSVKEDEKVKVCCRGLREIALSGYANELLVAHLRVCRQLGR